MIYLALLVVELIVLFVTSKHISRGIFAISKRIFRKDSLAMVPVFVLFLPGVVIHELAHFLMAEILFVKTYDLEVAPRLQHGYLQMGSVQVAKTDILRRFLIGVAPVIAGIALLSMIVWFFVNMIGFSAMFSNPLNVLLTFLTLWACFFIPNTMFSSSKDMEGAEVLGAVILFLMLVVSIVFYILKVNPIPSISTFLSNEAISQNLRMVAILLSIPLTINVLVLISSKLIFRRVI